MLDKVDFWWETMRVNDTNAMMWDRFEEIFPNKYYREVVRHTKRMEFKHLRGDHDSVRV